MESIPNALTIDVEEYFHVEALADVVRRDQWDALESRVVENTARVLDLLAETNTRGTFFTLGWVARKDPALVRRIANAGHEVASHGDMHCMITKMDPAAFREDVSVAKRALEDASGAPVRGYRAPTFSIVERTLWAADVLLECGYTYDSSIYPIVHDRYGMPDAPRTPHRLETERGRKLVEFPLTTIRVGGRNLPAGGGGYLRLLPITYNVWALHRAQKEAPFIVYFHPWEIDPDQPRFLLPMLQRWRAYSGLDTMEPRLRTLLAEFSFAPASEVLTKLGLLAGEHAPVRLRPSQPEAAR